ncbi:aromatic acid exporter family protein [Brevibacillus sp. SYP-B805]|uniref:aromatic acid exporter family protein n=1 Tax=Brevibacillus sp. SYP-B805 TaxID=1578199 RepID=UPI0013EBDCDF|nr:aromatic acid exporter family protein [Brevibacillus sp. SYP-B805]NGQ96793.1 aromatic acid exporter family protein [Brevibacillus sp. SYP-B805]
MKIGYRTIKTAVGVALSVSLAQYIGLPFFAMAGIITMLGIQVTRRQSLLSSGKRIAACLLGMMISFLLFHLLGYHPLTILLAVLLLIPLLVKFKLQDGITTSTVIILQIYSLKQFTLPILLHEIGLIGIGVGVALLMNLHMPTRVKELKQYRQAIERNISVILKEFALYLRQGESSWDGKEMIETEDLLRAARRLARQEEENQFFRQENPYERCFSMRAEQFELLERMLPVVSTLNQDLPQGQRLAAFMEKLSAHIVDSRSDHDFLQELREMRREHKTAPLPVTREEFEIRASLFYLYNEMEHFLMIHARFANTGDEKNSFG